MPPWHFRRIISPNTVRSYTEQEFLMRQGFTLIELMIVIAIIAIIASIAIPNLLESRITANEANAATSLKSGVFPAQVQYQSGGYVDVDSDGRGIYAGNPVYLAGVTGAATALANGPAKALSLLDPAKFGTAGSVANPAVTTTANCPRNGAYDYGCLIDLATEDNAESFWAAFAVPATTTGSEARRAFAVNAAGNVYQTKGTVAQSNTTMALLGTATTSTNMLVNVTSTIATPSSTNAVPYQK